MSNREQYNGGEWTKARFLSFVKSVLRSGSRKWPPKYKALNAAFVGTQVNSKSGRLAKHYQCAACKKSFPMKDVQVDHIEPIVDPKVGFTSWDDVVYRLFCEIKNLQVLCTSCHKEKSKRERGERQKTLSERRKRLEKHDPEV